VQEYRPLLRKYTALLQRSLSAVRRHGNAVFALYTNMQVVLGFHCNTLQHTATHYNITHASLRSPPLSCNTLQHTATHCNAMQHTTTHCNTLQHTATQCNTLQHAATHCNAMQHTATLLVPAQGPRHFSSTHRNTQQHAATLPAQA